MKGSAGAAPLLLAAALIISACAKDAPNDIPCPAVEVLPDLGEFVRYRPGPGRDPTDVLQEAWIDGVGGKCELDGSDLLVDLGVRIGIRRGPATKTDQAKIGYFVAITDLKRNVLNRRPFEATAQFLNRKTVMFDDQLDLRIPLSQGDQTDSFVVYVGLELTKDELKANRNRRK